MHIIMFKKSTINKLSIVENSNLNNLEIKSFAHCYRLVYILNNTTKY